MNEVVNKFLLAGDKFMPEMHLKLPVFTYSACGPLTKNKEIIQKCKETGDSRYLYRNEFGKAYFQHDMAYADFKNLARRTASGKVVRDKVFNIAKNPKNDGYQRGLASKVYQFFDKKTSGKIVNNEIKQNQQLAEELHKPIIKKFKKRRIYSSFKNNIWSAYLADIQIVSKFNKGTRFLICVIDIFSKYALVVPLKDKNCVTVVNTFQ